MRVLILLVGALAVAASGCGRSSSGSPSPPAGGSTAAAGAGAATRTITIREREFSLSPGSVTLAKPGTYVFRAVNRGTIAHALAVAGGGVHAASGEISPGGTATLRVTLPRAGRYRLYCPVDGHAGQGMEGTIAVGVPAPAGTSTGTTTGTSQRGYGY